MPADDEVRALVFFSLITNIVALIFVLMNLVVDILYLFLDPRISYS